LMSFLLLAGVLTALSIKVEVVPEVSLDMISVTVKYPGASPSEVEASVVREIEERVAGLEGVKRIYSTAREGLGSVRIEVLEGFDVRQLLDEVKSEVEQITTFPEEAERPVVKEMARSREVINVALYGEVSEEVLKTLAERVKDGITRLPGVTQAELFGVREREIHIEVSEEALKRYGLTLGQVAEAVRRGSLDLPAGSIKASDREILIRAKGRRYYADRYRDLVIVARPDGSRVTLGEIASLEEGFEDVDLLARFMGKPAAVVKVWRIGEQNALEVAKAVKDYVERIKPTLPPGVDIDFFWDMSRVLRSRLRLLLKNMALGMVLVVITLGVFLQPRLAFWITMGIPVAFATGLWLLPKFDVSINMVSLFAFIMVLGIVVDDAIVIGESVFRKREEGLGRLEAAVEGANEVAGPVVFSVLTTMAAFVPLMMAGGTMGKLLRNIPLVVIVVLAGSLTEALLVLPAHLARSKGGKAPGRVTRGLRRFIHGPYAKFLSLCLRWRYLVAALGVALLLLSLGLWRGGRLLFTFFPRVESDWMACHLTMPPGTPLERTLEVVERIEEAAKEALSEAERDFSLEVPLLESMTSFVGLQMGGGFHRGKIQVGEHLAQVIVQLVEGEKRPGISARGLAALWRKKVGTIPDVEALTFQSELFSLGKAIEINLYHEDHRVLIAAAERLKDALRGYSGVYDIADSFIPGKEEVRIRLKPKARDLGLSMSDVAYQVRHAFYGAEALRFQRDRDEVKVMVRYPVSERRSLGRLEEMWIRTPSGHEVPLREVAELEMAQEYLSIERVDRRRVITVSADVDEAVANADRIRKDLQRGVLPLLEDEFPGLSYSIEGAGKEQKESMADVEKGFILALFLIYALLAVPFRSFSQPLIVMTAIPFGIVGAFLGHLIMGLDLSMLSFFGIVGLSGVVVNDSLILINAINRLRTQGVPLQEAVLRGGTLRFRAVILTTLTTFAGLTPLILERSLQARFLIPMAVSLGFGVLFATFITLILIPCGYMIFEDVRRGPGGLA